MISKRPLSRLDIQRTLPQLNHLTLQVQQHIMVCTFHYFKQSSKLSVCCSRACDKETQYFRYCFKIRRVYNTNLFILAPYRIFVYSNVFVLMGTRMNWIVLSQFFHFHREPVVNVIGRTTTDIADTEIVN